jgi:hypothetical protein
MKPEQQRIAIAKACGFTNVKIGMNRITLLGTRRKKRGPVPDYLNDLNAMHEAEKVLNEKQVTWYMQKLTQIRYMSGVSGMIGCMIDKIVLATAAQRAEAFLLTLGLWEESK